MSGDKIPPITVQQRLFVDRWWANGGDMIEAVEYAGYVGYAYPSDKAAKGRKILSSQAVKKYVAYLKASEKADRKAAAQDAALAAERAKRLVDRESGRSGRDQKSEPVLSGIGGDAVVESSGVGGLSPLVDVCQEKPDSVSVVVGDEPSSGPLTGSVSWPGRPRSLTPTDLGSHVAGGMIPPHQLLPAKDCTSAELTPGEVRLILASIARGNERGMADSRTRMRAIELAMRNMGMLVDVSLTATTTAQQQAGPDVRTMTAEQRQAEMQKLESFFNQIKEAAAPQPEQESSVGPESLNNQEPEPML